MKANVKIISVTEEAAAVKTFEVEKPEGFTFDPGQYCWIKLPGYKAAPMAIASGTMEYTIKFSIRAWGDLTRALFQLTAGDTMILDGPHGTGFNQISDESLYLIAGGTGVTPVRSVIKSLKREDVKVFYGAKTPEELLYANEITRWNADVRLTVDTSSNGWSGNVGLVTSLLKAEEMDPSGVAFVCGPVPMEAAVVKHLRELGFEDDRIFVSLEKFDEDGNVVGPVLPVTHPQVEF